jgi:hypothetical protein
MKKSNDLMATKYEFVHPKTDSIYKLSVDENGKVSSILNKDNLFDIITSFFKDGVITKCERELAITETAFIPNGSVSPKFVGYNVTFHDGSIAHFEFDQRTCFFCFKDGKEVTVLNEKILALVYLCYQIGLKFEMYWIYRD